MWLAEFDNPVAIWQRYRSTLQAGTLAVLTDVFRGFTQSLQASARIISLLGHHSFILNHTQFTIHDSPIKWVPGVKQPGRETDSSPPSSAEFKNDEIIPPVPHTSSWRDPSLTKHRDSFTFLYLASTYHSRLHSLATRSVVKKHHEKGLNLRKNTHSKLNPDK
jgi:hypothetical protein